MLAFVVSGVLVMFLGGGGCSKSTQHGPATGGPAILVGSFEVSTVIPGPVLVRAFWPTDYSLPLGSATISPTDTFTIADLPADSVDVIVTSPNYFALKECDFSLTEGVNAFEEVSVYTGRTHRYALNDTSWLDEQGWPKWVLDEVLLKFKDATIDSSGANSILMAYGCSVTRASRSLFTVDIPDTRTVPEVIELLTLHELTRYACPNGIMYPHDGGLGEVY